MTRKLDDIPLPRIDRDLIDATITAASDLAPQWFPRKHNLPR
jgi:hypothetical protein